MARNSSKNDIRDVGSTADFDDLSDFAVFLWFLIFFAIGTSECLPRLKIAFLAQKKAILGKWCQKTGSQSSQTGTYRKTEIIQSYLRTWGSHWVRSVWGKIRWLYGRSIGRNWFLGRKCSFLVQKFWHFFEFAWSLPHFFWGKIISINCK